MDYKIVVTRDAEEDLERFIKYLIIEKESMQAAEKRPAGITAVSL